MHFYLHSTHQRDVSLEDGLFLAEQFVQPLLIFGVTRHLFESLHDVSSMLSVNDGHQASFPQAMFQELNCSKAVLVDRRCRCRRSCILLHDCEFKVGNLGRLRHVEGLGCR